MNGDFITTNEAAEQMGYTPDYVSVLCKNGSLAGVFKFGDTWAIPAQSVKDYRPGLRGFAATQEKKRQQAKAELAEINEKIRAAKGLPADDGSNEERGQDALSGSYITIDDAAEIFGRSKRTLRQFCDWGKIEGARKLKTNKSWIMPYDEVKRVSAILQRRIKRPTV